MTAREVFVLSCFIGVPMVLVVLHLFLSYRENAWYGAIVPLLWGILSFFVVKAGTGQAVKEMIIFCYGIDFILLLIWFVERKWKVYRQQK